MLFQQPAKRNFWENEGIFCFFFFSEETENFKDFRFCLSIIFSETTEWIAAINFLIWILIKWVGFEWLFFTHSDWKKECALKTGLCIFFKCFPRLAFCVGHQSSWSSGLNGQKGSFWNILAGTCLSSRSEEGKFWTILWKINNVQNGKVSHNILNMRLCEKCIGRDKKR